MKFNLKKVKLTLCTLAATALCTLMNPMSVLADNGFDVDNTFDTVDPSSLSGGKVLAGILNVICYIAGFLGIIFVAIGVFQIVMGFRNDDGESKSRGGLQAGSGVALLSLGIILRAIFL